MDDCIVVGAGPAGCAAALGLARAGVDVLLLERAPAFPRAKVCGDGLTPASLRELQALGVQTPGANPVDGGVLFAPGGGSVEMAGTAAVVWRRAELDVALFRAVQQAGVRVRLGAHVRAVTAGGDGAEVRLDGERLQARVVVLASGSRSSLPITTGLQRPPPADAVARRAYFCGVRWPSTRLLFCYARELLPAYGWVFPLGRGEANVGVGSFLGESRASDLAPAFARFRAWLARQGILDAAARGEQEATDLLRTGMRGNALVGDRLLAAGDAAGTIDPLSGEGVSQALGSGRLAAEAVRRALAAGRCDARALKGYRAAMRSAYRSRSLQALWTRKLLRSNRLVDSLVRLSGRDARLAGGVYEMLVGELQPWAVMRRAARATLAPRAS